MKATFFLISLLTILTACSQSSGCKTTGDRKNGLYVDYYSDCKKKIECYFKNGIYDSTYTEWMENGKVKVSGKYKNGKKQGTWRYNGLLLDGSSAKHNFMYSEYTYQDGILKNGYDYLSSSDSIKPKSSETFVIYGKDTIEKHLVFRENGLLASENFLIDGKSDSISKIWDENGKLYRETYLKKSRSIKDIHYYMDRTNVLLYKDGFKQVFRQFDLSGKLLYEAYYDKKGKITKTSGKRIGNDNDE